jgi:serine protease Do
MKRIVRWISAGIVFSIAAGGGLQAQNRNRAAQSLAELSDSLRDLSATVSMSVVQITATGYGIDNGEQRNGVSQLSRQRSTGSGIVVSDDGYIITNAHVVEEGRSIRVKVSGQRSAQTSLFDAKLIGADSVLDLALLKIQAQGLKPLTFASSMDVKQGQIVMAFGNPLGLENSVSMGVISATERQLSEDDPRIFLQTDTPINPGNSGGPLVDVQGRVIGINTFIFSQSGGNEGIGFAIPSNVVRYAYASFKRDGHVHRGQIGVNARTITPPLAIVFNLEPENGVLVEDVIPGGPADKAGLRVGDVILTMNETPLHNVRDLSLQLYEYGIGNKITLQVLRDQKKIPIFVTVTERQNDPVRFADLVNPDKNLIAKLAILGVTIDDQIRDLLPLRIDKGVLVAAFAGSPLYFGDQIHQGDIIHGVNGQTVASVDELRTQLDNVTRGQPIVLQVERSASLNFLVLEGN